MKHHLGLLLQLAALTFLPMVIIWQLNFGIPLLVMPACTVGAIFVFWLGTRLREGR